MTHDFDRVLVCVVNRKRDYERLRDERWYRIPQAEMPAGVEAELLAFFFSRAFGPLNGAIHTYARITGIELSRRAWLLPDEAAHQRADNTYFRVSVGALERKHPPVTNPDKRVVSFIRTTWARFEAARTVNDLYLK